MTENVNIEKQPAGMKAIAELSAVIGSAIEASGYSKEESQSITEVAIKAMSFMAGGRQFYLPRGKALEIAIRNRKLFQEFTGKNIHALVNKYNISEVQVYKIIKSQREAAQQNNIRH